MGPIKTSNTGMPFSVVLSPRRSGGRRFSKLPLQQKILQPSRDFLVARGGKPMEYASMVAQLRRCLQLYGELSADEAGRFTLHTKDSAQQGLNSPGSRPGFAISADTTESESDGKCDMLQPTPDVADPEDFSDIECDSDVAEEAGAPDCGFSGPWLLNTKTGWSHGAVERANCPEREEPQRWALACRPGAAMSSWFEVRRCDPELEGFQSCSHSGCFPKRAGAQ